MHCWEPTLVALLGLGAVVSIAGCPEASTPTPDAAVGADVSGDTSPPPTGLLAYYPESYDASRTRFLATSEQLAQTYVGVTMQALSVPSATDDDLTIDVTTIPAQAPEGADTGLLIMMSGVHGVEAFAGSAAVQMFVDEQLPSVDLSRLSVMFIHAVNPWGFRHKRRVSENNVDLNRNFSVDASLFDTVNAGYADIDFFLNKSEPVSPEAIESAAFDALVFAADKDRAALQEAILRGQYQFPQGVYYGGADFEPNRNLLDPVLREAIAEHARVFLMDFHTGYGETGKLHLFGAPGLGTPEAMATVFEGYSIDTGADNPDFYETDGDTIIYVGNLAAAESKVYLGMTMEYGTLNSQTDGGAVQSLVNVQLENQGHHHGYTTTEAETQMKATFFAGYLPVDEAWRTGILEQTREMLPVLIERFVGLGQ